VEKWSKLPLVEKHTYNYFFNHLLLLLTVRSWSWLQLQALPKIWAHESSSFVKSWRLKTINLFFSTCLGNENLILYGIIRNEVIPLGVEVHMYVCIDVGTYCTKLETYLSCEVWCKKFPNAVYKGKSLHVHRNNKNYILKSHNSKYTHCFLIHLNIKKY
jgi:hypothetical protein